MPWTARRVLAWRFGGTREGVPTLEAIGTRLGNSRERVRQIEKESLRRLRSSENLLRIAEELGLGEGARSA